MDSLAASVAGAPCQEMKRAIVLLAMLATAQDDVIKVATRLVQFNVIASDRKGPVADLTKADFTILDHGKRREIAVFHMDSRQRIPWKNLPRSRRTCSPTGVRWSETRPSSCSTA